MRVRIMVGFKHLEPTGAVHVKWRLNLPSMMISNGVHWYDWKDDFPELMPPEYIFEERLNEIEKELI